MYGTAGDSLNDSVKKKFILNFLKNADMRIDDMNTVEITHENLSDNLEDEVKEDLKKGKIIVSIRKI